MLRMSPLLIKNTSNLSRNCLQKVNHRNFGSRNIQTTDDWAKIKLTRKVVVKTPSIIITAGKKNISQSPWKMNFLVKLIRGLWVPDALAQLKFSPKHRAVDVGKIVQRAVSIAKIFHGSIPEELIIKEIFVTKGIALKRVRIMGRGRSGVGYMRSTHVTVKLEIIKWKEHIKNQLTHSQKAKWAKLQIFAATRRTELLLDPLPLNAEIKAEA